MLTHSGEKIISFFLINVDDVTIYTAYTSFSGHEAWLSISVLSEFPYSIVFIPLPGIDDCVLLAAWLLYYRQFLSTSNGDWYFP